MTERDEPAGPVPDGSGDGTQPPLDFDPYRFGAPEHPVPPEYAPPGYRPPATQPPPPQATGAPPPYPGYPQAGYGPPAGPGQYPQAPYGTPYGAPPPPYGSPYPTPRTGNGKAVAALVLGIASIVLCWLSFLDAVLVVLALVFGGITLSESRRRPGREGRRMAIAAIVCAIVGALLAAAFSVWIISTYKDCFHYGVGSSDYNTCVRNKS